MMFRLRSIAVSAALSIVLSTTTGRSAQPSGQEVDPERFKADASSCFEKAGITPDQWEALKDRPGAQARQSVAIIRCLDEMGYRIDMDVPLTVLRDIDFALLVSCP